LPGIALEKIFQVLREDKAAVDSVFTFYMERGFLKANLADGAGAGDHLVCVYAYRNPPPAIIGSAALRNLCVPALFGIKDTGQLTPGWARVRDFYTALAKLPDTVLDPSLNKSSGNPDREGFQLVTKDQPSQAQVAAVTRQITHQVEQNLRKEISTLRHEVQQYRTNQVTRQEMQQVESRMDIMESNSATKAELAQATTTTTQMLQMSQRMMEALMERMAAHGVIVAPPAPGLQPMTAYHTAQGAQYVEEEADQDVHMEEAGDDLDQPREPQG